MSYRIDLHMHTKESSACASATASEQVQRYKECGYQGVVVTDHFLNGNTTVPKTLSWEKRVELFCKGYENAKEEGERIGLDVFFGWESAYQGTDFLVYGLDKQWLLEHPEIETCSIKEQYKLVKESGGYLFQAHPYREDSYIPKVRLCSQYVDGVEVYNEGNVKRNPLYNEYAYEYAKRNYLPMIEGSDAHHLTDAIGGIELTHRVSDIKELCQLIMTGKGYRLMHGMELSPIVYQGAIGAENRLEKEMRVYELLEKLQVPFIRLDHEETATIEDCHEVDRILEIEICKNLFLCNSKRDQYYLLMMLGNKKLKTPEVARQIKSTRLSFGSPEYMEKYLDITPGSVSVLGLMNDTDNKVQLIIDEDLTGMEYVGCHPCINTSSLKLRTKDLLEVILPAIHHTPLYVTLDTEN